MKKNGHGNSCVLRLWISVCFFALSSCGAVIAAQQNPETLAPAPSTQPQDVKPAILAISNYSQNIALLGTDQRYIELDSLQARRRTFFMYGMGVSESYVDNSGANPAGQDSNQFLWSPHVALINASNYSAFSVQYAPTILESISGPSRHQMFQAGTISFGQPIAPNWVLQLSSSNTYGTDLSRLLSPQGFNVNKGVPIADPNSAVFQFNRGNVFTTVNDAGLRWQRSPSQALSFSVQESYLSQLDAGTSNTATLAQVSYSAAISPRTAFNVGGNYFHQTFSFGGCDGYGFTFGISHQISRYLSLSFGGGPEFAKAPCNNGLGGNYAVSISYPLSRRSRLGLSAGRSYTTNYLSNTQWTDTAAVSYGRQLSEAFQINLNSGYARGVLVPASVGTYVGYFSGADLSWKVSRTISLTTSYRRFQQVSGGPNVAQNAAMISLGWNPFPIRIVR